jgi:hypothetical protein
MEANALLSAFKQAIPAGTIVARSCSDDAREGEWACTQEFGAAPGADDLRVLQSLDEAARSALSTLYAVHAGARLFVVDGVPGLVLAPPQEWSELAEEMAVWWREFDSDDIDDELREMLDSALVFGGIESSATYFVLVRAGELKGHVALFSHDGLELISLAPSFADFLRLIPLQGIDWIHADVRYLGRDAIEQFYPIAYRPGGKVQPARFTLRIAIESSGFANTVRHEFLESTDTEIDIAAPSGNRYSLVVEFHDDCSASLSIDAEDGESSFYFSGSGTMKIQAQFAAGDIVNGDIALRPG